MNKGLDKTLGSSIVSTWITATRPAGTINSVAETLGLAMTSATKPPRVATSLMSTMKATHGPVGLAMANSFKPPNVATTLMSTMKAATATAGLANTAAQIINSGITNSFKPPSVATSIMSTIKTTNTPVGLANTAAHIKLAMANSFKPPSIATSIMSTMEMVGLSSWAPRLRSGVSQSFLLSDILSNEVASDLKSDAVLDEASLSFKYQSEAQSSLEGFYSDPVLSFVYRVAISWNEFRKEKLQILLVNADRHLAKRLYIATNLFGATISLGMVKHFIQGGDSFGIVLSLCVMVFFIEILIWLQRYK